MLPHLSTVTVLEMAKQKVQSKTSSHTFLLYLALLEKVCNTKDIEEKDSSSTFLYLAILSNCFDLLLFYAKTLEFARVLDGQCILCPLFFKKNNPVKYVDPDGECPKDALLSFIKNDNSSVIFTLSISASGTVLPTAGGVGAGVFINPKNDALFGFSVTLLQNPSTALIGMTLLLNNIEDAGVFGDASAGIGIGYSGSVTLTVGAFKSVEDAHGPYFAVGLSGGEAVSIGADLILNLDEEVIGGTVSGGIGGGTPLEGHARWGASLFFSIKNNIEKNYNKDVIIE